MLNLLAAATLLPLSAAVSAAPSNVSWRWDPQTIGMSCTLVQKLETSTTPVTIGQSVGDGDPGYFVEIRVRSPRLARNTYEDGWIIFENGVRVAADFAIYSIENRQYRIAATTDDAAFLDALSKSSGVTLEHADFGTFAAKFRDSSAAAGALRTCEKTLLSQWGIDPVAYAGLRSRPEPLIPLHEFFSGDDYPVARARAGMVSNIVAKLEVAADGSVRSCAPHGEHKVPDFVEVVCTRLKSKARFVPARDAHGDAVSAPFVITARFVLN